MENHQNIDALCSIEEAYKVTPEAEKLFVSAMRDNFAWQVQKQPYIAYMAERLSLSPEDICSIEDAYRLPCLFVGTMKINDFCSTGRDEIALTLTSSGTGGQKTHLYLDSPSLKRLEKLAYSCFESIGCTSPEPVHCFLMSYAPSDSHNIGTSWSQVHKRDLTPLKSEHWALEKDENSGEFTFDAGKWARKIIELSGDAPVRLLGFPAFMCSIVEEIKKIRGKLKLLPGSFIISGGGWKNHLGQPMTHGEFTQYMSINLGIDPDNIRDTFGMAEHGIPYIACRKGNFHVPVYSRLRTIDPLSGGDTGMGREGLLCLYTPYNTAQPNQAVLSTDIVEINLGCECGINGAYIKSVRRGGTRKHKGCAIAAQEILKKSGEAR